MSLTAVPIGLTFLSFVVNSSDVVAFFHLVTYFFNWRKFTCLHYVTFLLLGKISCSCACGRHSVIAVVSSGCDSVVAAAAMVVV